MMTGIEDTPRNAQKDLEIPYFSFVREERQFCALLAHLLVERGDNLQRFLSLVDKQLTDLRLPSYLGHADALVAEAEVYVEFAYLRDRWDRFSLESAKNLEACNTSKRQFILGLMDRVPGLIPLRAHTWPESPKEFNDLFIGKSGPKIAEDIASPVHWRVPTLRTLAEAVAGDDKPKQQTLFRDLCRFKWAFNIKPDLVIILPERRPLCIEAKVLSPESHYPNKRQDAQVFDQVFGKSKGRVHQVELQEFLFQSVLGWDSQHVLIDRRMASPTVPPEDGQSAKVPVLSWQLVLNNLNCSTSLHFVAKFIQKNVLVRETLPEQPVTLPGANGLPYYDGTARGLDSVLTLLAARRREGRQTQVGYDGGKSGLKTRALESLIARDWKWRDPTIGNGKIQQRNWIDAAEFEAIIEQLREGQETS